MFARLGGPKPRSDRIPSQEPYSRPPLFSYLLASSWLGFRLLHSKTNVTPKTRIKHLFPRKKKDGRGGGVQTTKSGVTVDIVVIVGGGFVSGFRQEKEGGSSSRAVTPVVLCGGGGGGGGSRDGGGLALERGHVRVAALVDGLEQLFALAFHAMRL